MDDVSDDGKDKTEDADGEDPLVPYLRVRVKTLCEGDTNTRGAQRKERREEKEQAKERRGTSEEELRQEETSGGGKICPPLRVPWMSYPERRRWCKVSLTCPLKLKAQLITHADGRVHRDL